MVIEGCWVPSHFQPSFSCKNNPPAQSYRVGGCFAANSRVKLRLHDSWRQEENQLLVAGLHCLVFKEVAQPRDAPEERHLVD